eukprot:m.343182 g.343182  ORF g.343182 m.343182 type:complete len:526 (+) comp22446_c0_seq1:338-1915(+)
MGSNGVGRGKRLTGGVGPAAPTPRQTRLARRLSQNGGNRRQSMPEEEDMQSYDFHTGSTIPHQHLAQGHISLRTTATLDNWAKQPGDAAVYTPDKRYRVLGKIRIAADGNTASLVKDDGTVLNTFALQPRNHLHVCEDIVLDDSLGPLSSSTTRGSAGALEHNESNKHELYTLGDVTHRVVWKSLGGSSVDKHLDKVAAAITQAERERKSHKAKRIGGAQDSDDELEDVPPKQTSAGVASNLVPGNPPGIIPCKCGSVEHRRTTHVNCPLNKQVSKASSQKQKPFIQTPRAIVLARTESRRKMTKEEFFKLQREAAAGKRKPDELITVDLSKREANQSLNGTTKNNKRKSKSSETPKKKVDTTSKSRRTSVKTTSPSTRANSLGSTTPKVPTRVETNGKHTNSLGATIITASKPPLSSSNEKHANSLSSTPTATPMPPTSSENNEKHLLKYFQRLKTRVDSTLSFIVENIETMMKRQISATEANDKSRMLEVSSELSMAYNLSNDLYNTMMEKSEKLEEQISSLS